MRSKTYYLGADIGTSSCKTIIIDSAGNVSGQYSKDYHSKEDGKNYNEIEPDRWYEAFLYSLRKACGAAGIDPAQISGIGITGQMVTLVCVDKDSIPVRPAILWYDTRGFNYLSSLPDDKKNEIKQITCNPINSTFTLPKLVWLKENESRNYKKIHKVLWASDYIRMKLTGTFCTDMTNASSSLVYDVHKKQWSGKITDFFGIQKSILPDIVVADKVIGNVTREASLQTGLKHGVPVIVGTGDIGADNIAAGVIKKGQCSIRFGTCATISICTERPLIDPMNRCPCSCHSINDLFLIQGTSASFGSSISWFRDVFYKDFENEEAYEKMEKEISLVLKDSNSPLFHSFSKAAPYWNENMRGQFTGIDDYHCRGHFITALYEGISFDLKEALISLLKIKGASISSQVQAIGRGTRSESLCKIVCNILGLDLLKMENADAAFGVAILAMSGIEEIKNIGGIIKRCIRYSGEVRSDSNLREYYKRRYVKSKKSRDILVESLGLYL